MNFAKKILITLISSITLSTVLSNISIANENNINQKEPFFTGIWVREDGFTIALEQKTKFDSSLNFSFVKITGNDINFIYEDNDGFEYEFESILHIIDFSRVFFKVFRKSKNGCIGTMYMDFTKISDSSFKQTTTGTDGKCGLKKNLTESFIYERGMDMNEE